MSAIRLCYPTGFIACPQPPSTFDWMYSDTKPTVCYGDQVPSIPKIAAQDTTLTVSNADGGKTTFPVPSGTMVDIHVPGLHNNRTLSDFISWDGDRFSRSLVARYWKEPHKFMPERFLGDWPRDAFIPFSQGMSRFIVIW